MEILPVRFVIKDLEKLVSTMGGYPATPAERSSGGTRKGTSYPCARQRADAESQQLFGNSALPADMTSA